MKNSRFQTPIMTSSAKICKSVGKFWLLAAHRPILMEASHNFLTVHQGPSFQMLRLGSRTLRALTHRELLESPMRELHKASSKVLSGNALGKTREELRFLGTLRQMSLIGTCLGAT